MCQHSVTPMDALAFPLLVGICLYAAYRFKALDRASSRTNRYEELRTLSELRDKGILTKEQFDREKHEVLKRRWWADE